MDLESITFISKKVSTFISKLISSEVKGKVAVITGSTGVLGKSISLGLAGRGVKIGVLGRNEEKIMQLCEEIIQAGGSALPLQSDVLDRETLASTRTIVLTEWGKVDILINSAGGNVAGAVVMPDQNFFDMREEDWDQVTNLNIKGTMLPTQVYGEVMAKQGFGSIINISSMAASRPMTRVMGYAASKAAVDNMTKWLATEMAHKYGEGVRVNAIAPGFFLTAQNKDLLTNSDGSLTDRGKSIISHTPMGRFGSPEDLHGAVYWLAGDESKFVTGIVIPVDGGFSSYSGV